MAPRTRKFPIKRRRKTKGKMRIPRSIPMKSDMTVTAHSAITQYIANGTVAESKYAYSFTLDSTTHYTTYTGLFDQYRINFVTVKFVPRSVQVLNKPFDDTSGAGQRAPKYVVVIDRDDASVPVSYEETLSRAGAREQVATKPLTIKFTPSRLLMVYRTGSTTGYKIDTDTQGWLDCANADIPHFGIKTVFEAASPLGAYDMEVRMDYNISFRGRRK